MTLSRPMVARSTAIPSMLRAAYRTSALLVGLHATPLAAQSIGVQLGDSARLFVAPGGKLTVPVRLDMSAAANGNLASLTTGLSWNAARLTLDSLRAGTSGASVTSNLAGVSGGTATLGVFTPSGLTASTVLAQAYFTAATTTGGSRVTLLPTVAGNELGTSILGQLRIRGVDVCVSTAGGKWGDVTDDGQVNIIDAQQVARHSVGLTVSNTTALTARGDVTADGSINIIDAQQIARFSVGLSSAPRTNTAQAATPTASTLAVTPSTAQTLPPGGTVRLSAVPRDGAGVDLTGCVPVTFASSNTVVATVSADGLVTGVGAGTATIMASAGAQSQAVTVTVQSLYTLVVATQPAGGTSNELLPGQPVVQVRDGANALVTAAGQSVTASIASGSGTLSGTTTVPVVNGVATFTDLAVTGTGAHTLRFSGAGAQDATSSSFTMAVPTTMRLLVGQTPTQEGTAGTDVVLPLVLDLAGRGSQDLASIQATITWDPAKFTYVANGAGTWVDQAGDAATITVNTTQVATGSLTVGGFTNGATVATGILRTLTLRPVATGPLVVNGQVTVAGNAAGQNVTVRVRQLGLVSTAAGVASVRLTPTTATLGIGQNVDLTATPLDANGAALTGRTVTFSTSAPAIATVASTGRVIGLAPGTATITATSEGRSATATITVSDLVPGLAASLYVIPVAPPSQIPNFRSMVPYRLGSVSNLNYPVASADTNISGPGRTDLFGAVFDGFLDIPTAGQWTLALASDDGAKLYINDSLIVNNESPSGSTERTGTLSLAAGRQALRVEMVEQFQGAVLVLRAEGPGFARQVIPGTMLWRRPESSASVSDPFVVLSAGQTAAPSVTVRGLDGTVVASPSVTWGTTAPTVATVTSTGAVTAVGPGTAYITATVNGRTVGGQVEVRAPLPQTVGAGFSHSCQRDGTGLVSCWGGDAGGQLGDGTAGGGDRLAPNPIATTTAFARVVTAWDRTCALTATGAAWCWGQGVTSTPTAVGGGLTFTQLEVGYGFSCGLTAAGAAYCWGNNDFGQLGNGTTTTSATPVLVSGGRTFTQITAGVDHACGVTAAGAAFCWGRNVYGALGDGTTTDRSTPVPVGNQIRFATLAAGEYFSCGFAQSGLLYCWGDNRGLQLTASAGNQPAPIVLASGQLLVSVTGGEQHLCGLMADGTALCRGRNTNGELGNGTILVGPFTTLSGGLRFTDLSAGRTHSCARTAAGAAYCWGTNGSGQLGDGTTTTRLQPTLVGPTQSSNATAASVEIANGPLQTVTGASTQLTVAVRDSTQSLLLGRSVTWMSSDTTRATVSASGLLQARAPGRVRVTAVSGSVVGAMTVEIHAPSGQYRSIFSGGTYSCAVKLDGAAECWGNIPGIPGSATPQPVFTTHRWKKLIGNHNALCGITTDSDLLCVGANPFGQLGTGAATSQVVSVPTPVSGGGKWSDVAMQMYSACGIKQPAGELWCWGGVGTWGLERSPVEQPTMVPSRVLPDRRGFSNLVSGTSHVCVQDNTGWTCLGETGAGFFPPFALGTPSTIRTVVGMGQGKTCSLTGLNQSYCFGLDQYGELTNGTQPNTGVSPTAPTLVAPGITWSTLSAGLAGHLCGIDTQARGYCWGSNRAGQVGDGTTVSRGSPVQIPGSWAQLAPGFGAWGIGNRDHTCGLTVQGEIWCWGEGESGELGNGLRQSSLVPVRVTIAGSSPVPVGSVTVTPSQTTLTPGQTVALAAVVRDSAGLALTGRIVTWATNDSTVARVSSTGVVTGVASGTVTITATSEGRSGSASIAVVAIPLQRSVLSAGGAHTCLLRQTNGALDCWGRNNVRQLGEGSTDSIRTVMSRVQTAVPFVSVSAGATHTCALTGDGEAYCWGSGTGATVPSLVGGTTRFRTISAGGGGPSSRYDYFESFSCGLTADGLAFCWGQNYFGQLGTGDKIASPMTPRPVAQGQMRFVHLAAGNSHACAISSTGTIHCWGGDNPNGALGYDGEPVLGPGPAIVLPADAGRAVQLALGGGGGMGQTYSCALTDLGRVYCWGSNTYQITGGDGPTPRRVAIGVAFKSLTARGFICGVSLNDKGYCWGSLFTGQSATPVPIDTSLNFLALAVGAHPVLGAHGCGLEVGGFVRCWGDNAGGQVGDGTTISPRLAPVIVIGSRADSTGRLQSDRYLGDRDMRAINYRGVNFRNTTLHRVDLRWALLAGTDLRSALLHGANMEFADLSGANVTGALADRGTRWPTGYSPFGRGMYLPGENYAGRDFSGLYLYNPDFYRANFTGAKMVGFSTAIAGFEEANFTDADLTNARIDRFSMARANLTRANLTNATISTVLDSAIFTGATVTGVSWTGSYFSSTTIWPAGFSPVGKGMIGPGLDFSGQAFVEANWTERDIRNANFTGADLRRARLWSAKLMNSNFTNARLDSTALEGADFTGATLTGATFIGARYNYTTKWPTGFNPVGRGMIATSSAPPMDPPTMLRGNPFPIMPLTSPGRPRAEPESVARRKASIDRLSHGKVSRQ